MVIKSFVEKYVIRLLIRRPECLGPALRGEGEGLKSAVMSGNLMSEQIHFQIESGQITELGYMHPVPQGEEDEDFARLPRNICYNI